MKNIRWHVYWLVDFLRGRPVRKYYNQVKNCYINGTSTEDTQIKLRKLINHAVNTTEFYKSYDRDIDLNQLPVTNKVKYKENYDKFLSSRYRNAKSNRIISTSGSTGIPFSMVQNKNKIIHNTAASILLCSLGNYFIGMKQAFIRIWTTYTEKTKLQSFIENVHMFDSTRLDTDGINNLLKKINKKHYKSIISFPSTFKAIDKFIDQTRFSLKNIRLQSIILMGENMPESIRKDLEEKFHCQVKSTYSNCENGIMGVQDTDNPEYYLDSESYFFEFLKNNSNKPVEEGEVGRIVITDLFNYAFPIIRYDTGDLAVFERQVMGNRYKIIVKELYGRRIDMIFDCNGKQISPVSVSEEIKHIEGIKQWQFVQSNKCEYELIINPETESINKEDIIHRLSTILGEGALLNIKFVKEIPVLNSGKRRLIVNLCLENREVGN
ncbi:MAG: phenylacetate--CoA ligase family protein [Candidatus Helarchaeota archaeon]